MPVQFTLLTLVPFDPCPNARMFLWRNSCSDERRLSLFPPRDVCNLEATGPSLGVQEREREGGGQSLYTETAIFSLAGPLF